MILFVNFQTVELFQRLMKCSPNLNPIDTGDKKGKYLIIFKYFIKLKIFLKIFDYNSISI